MFKKLLDSRGMTLAEIMVSVALLGTAIYMFTGSTNLIEKLNSSAKNKMNADRTAISIYEKVQSNVSRYQLTYEPEAFLSITNKDELFKTLPLAWNAKVITNVKDCEGCLGRAGYIIYPHPEYRGVYKLTIRFVHRKLIKSFKDYNFLVNGN